MGSKLTIDWKRLRGAWAALPLGLVLLWVFWPALGALARRWSTQAQYSHGYIVPLFSLYLLWARRDKLPATPGRPSWLGLALLVAGLGLHFIGSVVGFEW